MQLQSLGYIGVRTGDVDQWATYATRFLGMQLVEQSRGARAFRMDDRKQRLIVKADVSEGIGFYGWEVADAAALDALAAHLEKSAVAVARGSAALAAERRVADLIVFHDPVGNRLEAFHGAELAGEAFQPGRCISGFRTGPLGMGHAVLTAARLETVIPFYTEILGFRLSDYILRPFTAYFFHLNPRHHSLAFVDTGRDGVHHLMVELCYLDDVGQAYDLALRDPASIGATFGRHANDEMTSFYSISPSKFMVEYGWGGRSIEPSTWRPQERTDGPSLWGHDRMWLSPEKREEARAMRIALAEAGERAPLNVMDGNYLRARDVCPWWSASTAARKSG
jgi:2,3-dihydroxybiphenyl 1,2-dioxygenase